MSKKPQKLETERDKFIREYDTNAQIYNDMLNFKKGQQEALTPTVYNAKKKELENYLNKNNLLYNAAMEAKHAETKYIEYSKKLQVAVSLAGIAGTSDKVIEKLKSRKDTYHITLKEKNIAFEALYTQPKQPNQPKWNVQPSNNATQSQFKVSSRTNEIKKLASSLASTPTLLNRETREQFNVLKKSASKSGGDIQDNLNKMQSAISQTYNTISLSESKKTSLLKQFTDAAQKIVDKLTKKLPAEITIAVSKAKDAVEEANTALQTSPSDNSPRKND